MDTLKIKNRILQVLYGTLSHNELTGDEIAYITANFPLEKSTATNTASIDFSSLVFNHKADGMGDALSLSKKEIITLERRIQDIFEETDEGSPRSVAIETLLPTLNFKEIAWLVDSGVCYGLENQKKKAIMDLLKMAKNGSGGIQFGNLGGNIIED